MSTWGIVFLTCLALAPFTAGMSLVIAGAMFLHSIFTFRPNMSTGIDDSQLPDIVPAHEEAEQRVAQMIAEAPARRRRYLRERDEAMPSASAWYQCSNAMCRHKERLLTWHGDSQECENCGRSTYRMG